MLKVFDDVMKRIPLRPAREADAELEAVRHARKLAGRRTASSTTR